jgi:hypothetical protein
VFGSVMTHHWPGPPARSKLPARIVARLVGVGVLVAALAGPAGAHAETFVTAPRPTPPIQFVPANVPWPLSAARARKAARAKAIRAWGARQPKVVGVHRVSYSRIDCRVTWRSGTGRRLTRTVKVTRTSAYGVRAFTA